MDVIISLFVIDIKLKSSNVPLEFPVLLIRCYLFTWK